MQCPNCGTVNPEGAKFCRGCGRSLLAQSPAPVVQPAPPAAPPASAARPAPAAPPGRLGQLLDGADLFLAFIGTGLGALAGFLSATFLPRFSPQLQVPPFALALAVGVVAVLASLIVLVPVVYWVATDRASRKRMQLKQLIQKEKAFFMEIDSETSVLAGSES